MAQASGLSSVPAQPGKQGGPRQTEIQRLMEAGKRLFHANQDFQALEAFKKAFLLLSHLPEVPRHTRARCLFNLGATYIATGKPRKGLKCTRKAMELGATEDDGDFSFNMAAAFDALREPAKAAAYYREAAREYQGRRKAPQAAEALVKLAYCLAGTGDDASAAQGFRLAGRAYQEAHRAEEAAMALREAAKHFLRSPKYHPGDVLEVLQACGQLCAGIANLELLGSLHNHLGLHYTQLKGFGQAEDHFLQALQLCRGENFALCKRAVLLQNLGALYNAQQEPRRALAYHGEAANAYGVLGERAARAQCLYNLASAYSQLGNNLQAERGFQQAVEAFAEAGDTYGQAQGCEGLGTTHLRQGHPHLATQCYRQALALLERSKEASDVPRERILEKLAEVTNSQETPQGHNSQQEVFSTLEQTWPEGHRVLEGRAGPLRGLKPAAFDKTQVSQALG